MSPMASLCLVCGFKGTVYEMMEHRRTCYVCGKRTGTGWQLSDLCSLPKGHVGACKV